jgi:hypothetical protein
MLAEAEDCACHAFLLALGKILSETWFQNVLLAVSAAIGIFTIRLSSLQERRRATVDLVRDQQKDEILIKARSKVGKLIEDQGKLDCDALLRGKDTSDELQAIFTVLNAYEFMATGLRTGAFDRKTYQRMYHNSVTYYWAHLSEFVAKYRTKYQAENNVDGATAGTIYQDFQDLANDWIRHPLKKS